MSVNFIEGVIVEEVFMVQQPPNEGPSKLKKPKRRRNKKAPNTPGISHSDRPTQCQLRVANEVCGPTREEKRKEKKLKRQAARREAAAQKSTTENANGIPDALVRYLSTEEQAKLKEVLDKLNSCQINPQREKRSSESLNPKAGNTTSQKFPDYLSAEKVAEGLRTGSYISGEIRINPKKYTNAYISDPDDGKDIVMVGMLARNRALEGDIVAVQLLPRSQWIADSDGVTQRRGKVVRIMEAVHTRICVGTLSEVDSAFCKLTPRDSRFPRLLVSRTSLPPSLDVKTSKTLWQGVLVSWEVVDKALGLVEVEMGLEGDVETEINAIMVELGLDSTTLPDTLASVCPESLLTEQEIAMRLDLRGELVISIDPDGARDLDDCVSVQKLDGGQLLVGVHISDVAAAIPEGSELDVCVSKRATSVYLPDRVYHMLPRGLTARLSLLPGLERAGFSVLLTLRASDASVLAVEFRRSILRNAVQLTYAQAQALLDGEKKVEGGWPTVFGGFSIEQVREQLCLLNDIARKLLQKRVKRGFLKLDQPKASFSLDPATHLPVGVSPYPILEANRLIEELMLLANESVASELHARLGDEAFLRRHPPPKKEFINRLASDLSRIVDLDVSSAGSLARSLSIIKQNSPERLIPLTQLISRPMNRAKYFCGGEDPWHYALAVPLYTHFTSPIRRYADIVVHRLLASALEIVSTPCSDQEQNQNQAKICNAKKYAAKQASDRASTFFVSLYLRDHGPCLVTASVCGVLDRSLDVFVYQFALQIRVYLEKLEAEVESSGSGAGAKFKICWPKSRAQEISLFSEVIVMLEYDDRRLPPYLNAVLLPPA